MTTSRRTPAPRRSAAWASRGPPHLAGGAPEAVVRLDALPAEEAERLSFLLFGPAASDLPLLLEPISEEKPMPAEPKKILLAGGNGRLEAAYRRLAEEVGLELFYCERRLLGAPQNLVGVIICTGTVSHPLKDHVQKLAQKQGVPICYTGSHSQAGIRRAIAEVLAKTCRTEPGPRAGRGGKTVGPF